MDLYDIHTHDSVSTDEGEQSHPYILNVYPLGFEDAKDASLKHYFCCGVHPWYSEKPEPQLNFLSEIAADPRIIAIGEAGYDKLKGPQLNTQQITFEYQIELSEKLKKPLIIHCVKAWDELLATRKKYNPHQPWILHAYRGKPELTKQLIKHGLMFSFGERFNKESAKIIPDHLIFCETDDQDISIEEVYTNLAGAREESVITLAEKIKKNVSEIFPQLAAITTT